MGLIFGPTQGNFWLRPSPLLINWLPLGFPPFWGGKNYFQSKFLPWGKFGPFLNETLFPESKAHFWVLGKGPL